MDLFLNALKGQLNTLNLLILLFALPFIAALFNKVKLARIAVGAALLFYLFASTDYVPYYLVSKMESEYVPFDTPEPVKKNDSGEVFIHVVGGGYTFDRGLPSSSQLSPISLGRLVEGIRIANQICNSKLVFSGWKVSGQESMASVMRQAAISLGVDSSRVELLEEPRTTQEEANSFLRRFGKDVTLILVTDAIHMRRALDFFKQYGLDPYPAPTNYLAREDESHLILKWMPSPHNLLLMDRVLHEWLGTIKGKIT
jgi:uncharacterized SAM-binding protein YcdF (DUF218 family)